MTTLPFCLPPQISADTFLNDYWQKKPLLIKNGLPKLVGMFEPDDILELATFEDATARLITQVGKNQNQWTLQNSPFTQKDLANLPEFWTLLVQNMEQWSPELANLWHAFDFIPQWQRDDIMVSYAPTGGSVGRHYDEYDVFLAQGFGTRRWQLGRVCDETTEFLTGQPIRLLADTAEIWGEVVFDEVLEPGDVLYVPPRLAHYGVAQDDCLTFSFGFRRPNLIQILDNLADVATHHDRLCTPLQLKQSPQAAGKLDLASITQIKHTLLDLLNSPQGDLLINQAVFETVSKRQYDVMLSEEPIDFEELVEMLENGITLSQDMASRIVYQSLPTGEKIVYVNGERLTTTADDADPLAENMFSKAALQLLAYLADGEVIGLNDIEKAGVDMETIADWVDNAWVMVNEV